jgi:rhomboid family GlyGly-CTERM serine protease
VTAVVLAVAFAAYWYPPLSTVLHYDRGAILGGEIWRLITGPLVHFSGDHLFFNALVFAAAGFLIERRHNLLFAHLCLAASLAGSFCLILLSPGIAVFGGLSGIATMAVVFLAVEEAGRGTRGSLLWLAVLALTAGKMIAEWILGVPLFAGPEAFVIVPSVHISGGLVALGAYLADVRRRNILFMPSG